MKIDIEKFDAITALSNFTFFGYDVIYGPACTYFKRDNIDDRERTKIIFKKPNTDDRLCLHIDNNFNDFELVCHYYHRGKDNNEINFDKKYDLAEFDGNWDDLNDDVEFWLAKIVDEALLTNNKNETMRNVFTEYVEYATMPEFGPYSESDAILTAKLMNEYGLSFSKNKTINKNLKFDPPFTSNNILDWFEEIYLNLQKMYQRDVVNGDKNEAMCEEGPIQMRAFRNGGADMSFILFRTFKYEHEI